MAQSKIGGTKAFIHGKVGSEVYYTDHNLEGEIIQVIKSVPDTVRNPRTAAQNRVRIIMATLYKAVRALAPLVNHSFEGFAGGRPSLAHFFSINYELIKQDIENHPDTGYQFGLVQWKGAYPRPGAYIIADGQLKLSIRLTKFQQPTYNSLRVRYRPSASANTIKSMKSYLNMEIGDFLTIVAITSDGGVQYCKLTWVYEGDDSLVIDKNTFFEVFKVEGNLPINITISKSTSYYTMYWTSRIVGCSLGIILTKFVDDVQVRSSETMSVCTDVGSSYNEILATYPKGDKYYF